MVNIITQYDQPKFKARSAFDRYDSRIINMVWQKKELAKAMRLTGLPNLVSSHYYSSKVCSGEKATVFGCF
jgi:hypothetical protein